MKPYHRLLAIQSLVVILVSINRLGTLTTGYVAVNEFLRWVDFHNMLTLPLISLVAFYLLKKQLESGRPAEQESGVPGSGARARRHLARRHLARRHLALNLAFLVGVYVLGASYGNHELTNYLHTRFCPEGGVTDLCRIIIFNDDDFSHWLFFIGFVLVNVALLLLQVLYPYLGKLTRRDSLLLVANGLFIGLGVFANLAFEEIGLDLLVVALLAALSLSMLWRIGRQPLVVYYATAYTFGLVATGLVKGMAG